MSENIKNKNQKTNNNFNSNLGVNNALGYKIKISDSVVVSNE